MLRVHKQLWLVSPVEIYPHHKIGDATGHNSLMPRNNINRWFYRSDVQARRMTGARRPACSLAKPTAGMAQLAHHSQASNSQHNVLYLGSSLAKVLVGISSVAVYDTAAINQRFTQQNTTENSPPLMGRKFFSMQTDYPILLGIKEAHLYSCTHSHTHFNRQKSNVIPISEVSPNLSASCPQSWPVPIE